MILRDYQQEAVNKVFKEWESGNRSVIGVMGTGLGKTIVFSKIIQQLGKRAMVLAHRKELLHQCKDKLEKTTGIIAELEMGGFKASLSRDSGDFFKPNAQVICSTIQTQTAGGDGLGRMTKFRPMDYGLLIIDETHRAAAPSYRRVIDYYKQNPNLVVLGVTASADRSDRKSLGVIFDEVAFDEYDTLFGIKNGWLVPIHQRFVNVESMDISNVHEVAGELNSAELQSVVESEKPMQETVEAIFEIIHGLPERHLYSIPTEKWKDEVKGIIPKRAIAFTRFVNHAKMLSDILNRISFGISNWACGKTEDGERDKIIDNFRNDVGASVLCNANLLTEGYDDDGVEIIFMCAPLMSRIRYAQQVGRATRPHDSVARKLGDFKSSGIRCSMITRSQKPICQIIDFVGNSGKHKLVSMVDVLAGDYDDEIVARAAAVIRSSKVPMRPEKVLQEELEKREEEKKKKEAEEILRKSKIVGRANYNTKSVDPFDIFGITAAKPRGWDVKKQPSEKMKKVLRDYGLNPDDYDYAQTKQLVPEIIRRYKSGLCRIKQVAKLKEFGINATNFTFDQASQAFNHLKKVGWRRFGNESWKPVPKIKMPTRSVATVSMENPF